MCGDDTGPSLWQDIGSGFNVGFKALASAFSFGHYDGGDAKCDPDFATSKTLAGIGRDALIMAGTAGTGEGAVAAAEGTEVTEGTAEGGGDLAEACLLCFTAETLVQMADGTTKRICEVQVGDRVMSRDPLTGKESAKTVTATIKRLAPAVVTVSLTNAKTGKTETLTCTPEHPLYVQGQGWVEAGSLGIGTSIVSRAGPLLTVQSVTWQRETAQASDASSLANKPYTVYNLTVEDDHTYFVGSLGGGTWVHNQECLTRVGRWMHPDELAEMQRTGTVQESWSGTTHVASPADINAFARQAKPGSVYTEFDVPESSLQPTSEGWAKIVGPNSLEGRLAARKGLPIPQMPSATNINPITIK